MNGRFLAILVWDVPVSTDSIARWLGETDTAVIGVGGGVFMPMNTLTFTFPSDAFSEPVTVTYTTIPTVTSDMQDVGVFYELTAVSTATNQPVQLEPGQTFTSVVQYNKDQVSPCRRQPRQPRETMSAQK